jgi:hypothetical protein
MNVRCRILPLVIALVFLGASQICRAQATFQDTFTNRMTVTNISGSLSGTNTSATIETNEPSAGGKPGGHSLWISWVAPADGVATFDTHGSSFDTTLSSFYFNSTNDTTLSQLHLAARNDDDPNAPPTSLMQFGARAGQHYEISVDGFDGATGNILLNWSFINATSPPPIIVSTPDDRAARQGDIVSLTINMISTPSMQLKWFFYTNEVEVTGTNLTIASLQPTNVGLYTLRVSIGSVRFFTAPTEIQINSDGQTNALARDKLFDSITSPLIGSDGTTTLLANRLGFQPLGPTTGLVRGYTGSQVFNTTYATTDQNEPPHCGIIGGASYWLTYEPPADGTLALDTIGSSYDTVMEAYTYNSPPASYQDLISIACDNNSAGGTASRVQFAVLKRRQYVVAVDGVNGARGVAYLNYSLNTNQAPQPPALTSQPQTIVVTNGANVILAPLVGGSPPLHFVWTKDSIPITNTWSPALSLLNVSPVQTGDYLVTVTNDLGTTAATLSLHVVVPPSCSLTQTASNNLQMSLETQVGLLYFVEEASNLRGPWQTWTNIFTGDGKPLMITMPTISNAFYRVRVQ